MPFLAYFAVLLIAVASVTFGVDLLTAPLPREQPTIHKPAINSTNNKAAPKPIRQIPIGRVTARDNGDPEGKLSPVYPASPGGGPKETASNADKPATAPQQEANSAASIDKPAQAGPAQAEPTQIEPAKAEQAKAAAPVETTQEKPEPQVTPQPTRSASLQPNARPGSCNIAACAGAYKSFRAEDCTYQPYDGPRRLCESPPTQHEQTAARPRAPETGGRSRRGGELDDVVREVRQLTRRDMIDDEDRIYTRRRGVVVFEEPYDNEVILRPPREIGR